MAKMHTRAKRKFGLGSFGKLTKTRRKKRPKTFATKESADRWAKEHGISKYSLKSVKKNRRFQIVAE